jgi:hypothetical protein
MAIAEDKGWDRIVDAIEQKFGIQKHGRSERPVEDAREMTEKVAYVIFDREGERYKLERVAGPAIIDRKTFGSRRIGSDVRYENVYDPDEITFKTNFYREDGDEWEPIDPSALGL